MEPQVHAPKPTEAYTFACSICGDLSTDICVCCTKDACSNHRCTRCARCSDCCECEVPRGPERSAAADAGNELPFVPEASAEPDLNTPRGEVFENMQHQSEWNSSDREDEAEEVRPETE